MALRCFWARSVRAADPQQARFWTREWQAKEREAVKRVQGHRGVWEATWAPDGRATFEYGDQV